MPKSGVDFCDGKGKKLKLFYWNKKEKKAYFLMELFLKTELIKVFVADGTTLRAKLQG